MYVDLDTIADQDQKRSQGREGSRDVSREKMVDFLEDQGSRKIDS